MDVRTYVGGATAGFSDAADVANHWLPIVVALALGAMLVGLVVALRSVLLPLVAALCSLLTTAPLSACRPRLPRGFGAGTLGLQQAEHVYVDTADGLLHPRRPHDRTCPYGSPSASANGTSRDRAPADAVVFGMGATAGTVVAGTIVLLPLLVGIAVGSGCGLPAGARFALAAGLLVDVLVVRLLVVPAAIVLLGRHAWYLPRWLEFLPEGAAGSATTGTWRRDRSQPRSGSSFAGAGAC